MKVWLDPVSLDWWSPWVELYYKTRYGAAWRWYYLNWEQNHEWLA